MNIAFIPVRGGSKSIPLKNIKPINGKPLVYWTAKAANDAKKWANIGIGCGIAWVVIYSIILFASAYLGLGFGFLFM